MIPGMVQQAKQILRVGSQRKQEISEQSSRMKMKMVDVPKGHFAVYVGEEEKKKERFVVPLKYLKQPVFQDLLSRAEEEFGFHHPMAKLVIPCPIDDFVALTSRFSD